MRKLVMGMILLLGVIFLFSRKAEVHSISQLIREGRWYYLSLALFLIVSPTPAGIGAVEGVLTLASSTMYIPKESAMLITLAYRGITFWVPLAFGGIALRMLENQQ